jgi:signal transduction histidine kinase
LRSELAVPLLGTGNGLEGVLNIESPLPRAFTEEDQRLLEALAVQAVIAIQEMRLLDVILEIVEVLLTADENQLFELIIDKACDLINVSAGSIWTISEPDTLVLRQSTKDDRHGDRLPLAGSLTSQAIRLRRPIAVDDVRTHPSFQYRDWAVRRGWVSAIIVPLLIPNSDQPPLGSFSLYSDHLRDFSGWDQKLLLCLANHAAVAIHDAEQLAQLKLARERQATAETFAAVGDVAANLLHQLNNKIGAIPVRVQGIEDKCPDLLTRSDYLANNLQEIEQSARQAMAVVRDSLAHLRPVERGSVDVGRCLEDALHRALPPPAVKIFRTGLESLPRATAGEQQLEMIFYNLIENAFRAMAGQGELYLKGEHQDNEVIITIADTGPGVAPDIQPHMFEFPLISRESTGDQTQRLGFGLWWVKTLLDRSGGRLLFTTEPDQGTTFKVCLPAVKR